MVLKSIAPSWSNVPWGTMTAAVLSQPKAQPPSAAFTIDEAYPKPTLPSPDWVLVRVHVAGLNRAELRSREALPPAKAELNIFHQEYHEDPPVVLGEEFVGYVAEAGSNTTFESGELVTGFIYGGGKAHDGAYAQYTICHRRRLFRLPADADEKIPMEVLGAIPMSAWTAYGSLVLAGELKKGETILIHGASSSVGVWAILLAKDAGCTVIATTRQEEKIDRLKYAGADCAILEQDLKTKLSQAFPKGVDVVFELVGPDQVLELALPLLARRGRVVCTGVLSMNWQIPNFTPAKIPSTRRITFYTMTNLLALGSEDEELDQVEPFLADVVGKIQRGQYYSDMFLDRVFDLKKIGQAHEYMEANKAVGKVVVTVD